MPRMKIWHELFVTMGDHPAWPLLEMKYQNSPADNYV